MLVVLRQRFLLGRFHATKWGVSVFEQRFHEWPPSPWRLVRAVVARWYQWRREASPSVDELELDELVAALCRSTYGFRLPTYFRPGVPLRQYQPSKFGRNPAQVSTKTQFFPGRVMYGTTLVQDNYLCVPRCGDDGEIWWFLEGDLWTAELLHTLDRCVERMVYFGRAESLTTLRRVTEQAPEPNCTLFDRPPSSAAVSVLVPEPSARREDVEGVTNSPKVGRAIPQGARIVYAELPKSPPLDDKAVAHPAVSKSGLLQFAVAWSVPPSVSSTVRLTSRFRIASLRELLLLKSGGKAATWSRANRSLRTAVALMVGKDADGTPLVGHQHAEFMLWWDGNLATRLLVLRKSQPFDVDEIEALSRASQREYSWSMLGADDSWGVRLIPLDEVVPAPPGFTNVPASRWESVTPYVCSRHDLRDGKIRASDSIQEQIRRELVRRAVPGAMRTATMELGHEWVNVHLPPRSAGTRAFAGKRRGYWLRLEFPTPIAGPVRLGHSSSLGLGLFRPIPDG